jgi:outer membrane protein assembly factor BamB
MAGANVERTSWTSEEVRGKLEPVWFKPFEPYILPRVQIIASLGNLYISTAKGLYALDAKTGEEKWVYPTAMPLGHSPTVNNGTVYVGGYDRKIHAINAHSGTQLWTFEAGSGFSTNPLVINGMVYTGNRDGYFYAIHSEGQIAGKLSWKYKTQGPINYSAAYKDGVVFFASNDSHAYALDAAAGHLVWKSEKLPGAGFHSWWPVVNDDWVIFAGSSNYRFGSTNLGPGSLARLDLEDVYPNHKEDNRGTFVGPVGHEPGYWVQGTTTINTSEPTITENGSTVSITEYFEQKPWRRTYFVLNIDTGAEYTTDFNQNGIPEYAPILWFGTHGAGNRYPPVIGSDGVLYQTNNFKSDPWIAGGHISGWMIGTPYISIPNSGWNAVDEPVAYAGGGNLIYWNRCCDRVAGAFDISLPNDAPNRSWNYFVYDLDMKIPGYGEMTYVWEPYHSPSGGVYGGINGAYGFHGDQNPPIPYNGMVYMHRSNALIAFTPKSGAVQKLPKANIVETSKMSPDLSKDILKNLLITEIQKMVETGHLRPGYLNTGIFDLKGQHHCGDDLVDYWHNPAETIYSLILSLPHLPPDLQNQTIAYMQEEFENYPPYLYNHIGWQDGAPRELFDLPPDLDTYHENYAPRMRNYSFTGWKMNPFAFYAMWKYAEIFENAQEIYNQGKEKLDTPSTDDYLIDNPHVHNAYIAGYWGYLELEQLAGFPESLNVRIELERLLNLRASTFSKDIPDSYLNKGSDNYCRALSISRNFIYLVPELAQYLSDYAYDKVADAVDHYEQVAPYWFVSKNEATFAEGIIAPIYDTHGLFQAKALILNESREELLNYIDIPSFAIGDLFYIQQLILSIEAEG